MTWTFRNTGTTNWPSNVCLKRVHGDDEIKIATNILGNEIQPNGTAEFTIDFKAPNKPGDYNIFLRLVHSDNVEFGEKVWIDLKVTQEEVDSAMLRSQQMLEKFDNDDKLNTSLKLENQTTSEQEFEVQADTNEKNEADSSPFIKDEVSKPISVGENPANQVLIQEKRLEDLKLDDSI